MEASFKARSISTFPRLPGDRGEIPLIKFLSDWVFNFVETNIRKFSSFWREKSLIVLYTKTIKFYDYYLLLYLKYIYIYRIERKFLKYSSKKSIFSNNEELSWTFVEFMEVVIESSLGLLVSFSRTGIESQQGGCTGACIP